MRPGGAASARAVPVRAVPGDWDYGKIMALVRSCRLIGALYAR